MSISNSQHHSRFFWRSSAMFGILGTQGKFKEVNAAWENVLSLSTGQLLGKRFIDFIHPDDQPPVEHYLKQLKEGMPSISFTTRFANYEGKYHTILWEINNAASSEYAYYIVGMDITEREQPMMADEMINVLREGVILQYADGTIGACNSSAERIIELTADQMMGWTLVDPDWQLIHEDGSVFPTAAHPAICALRTGEASSDTRMGIVKPDNSTIWININTYPLWRDDVTMPYAVVISFADISQYKETEQTLRKNVATTTSSNLSEHHYDLWEWDLASNNMYFSSYWEKMLGFNAGELTQHIDSWHTRIHPDEQQQVMKALEDHLQGTTKIFETTHRVKHKNNEYIWVLTRAQAIKDESGKVYRVVGTHIDMNAGHNVEEQFKDAQLKYQQLMENEEDAIFVVDMETTAILDANKASARLYGYSHDELLQLTKGVLSAQPDKIEKMLKKVVKSTATQYHRKQDGSVFPAQVSITPFLLKGKQVFMIIVRDTSAQQKIEDSLWESEAKYRQLFEAASNPTIVFDTNTQQVFDVNQVAIDLYGYSKPEWLRMTTEDISAEPNKKKAPFGSGYKRQTIPLRWHKKRDGTVFPVEISNGNSYLFQGRSLVCTTLRDITERKAYEEVLRRERDFVQSLVEASPAFFVALNPSGKIRMINQAMLQATEYTKEEVEKLSFLESFITDEERPFVSDEFNHLIKSMQPSFVECHIRSKTEQLLLVEWHSRAVVKANGELDYFFGVGINMTERKKAESDLLLFKSIIESSQEAIYVRNKEERLIYANEAYRKLFGYNYEQANSKSILDNYTKESQKTWQEEVKKMLSDGDSWEGELDAVYNDGSEFPVWQRTDTIRDAENNILFSFSLMHDVSERKRMWDMIRQQWQEYQIIFNALPAMIWYRDKKNHLLRSNKIAGELLKKYKEIDDYTDCKDVIKLGRPQHGIVHSLNVSDDGKFTKESLRWLQFDKVPYEDTKGNMIGVIIFCIDITEHKREQFSLQNRSQQKVVNENDNFLISLFNIAELGISITDDRGRFLQINQAYADLHGYRREELLGQAFTITLPEENQSTAIQEYYDILLKGSESIHYGPSMKKHRDGHIFDINVMTTRVSMKERGRMLISIIKK